MKYSSKGDKLSDLAEDIDRDARKIQDIIDGLEGNTKLNKKDGRNYVLLSVASALNEEAPVGLVQLFSEEEYIYRIKTGNLHGINENPKSGIPGQGKNSSDCMSSIFIKKPETVEEDFIESIKDLEGGEYDFTEDTLLMCTTKEGTSRRFIKSVGRDFFEELYEGKEELDFEEFCPREKPVCFLREKVKEGYESGGIEIYDLPLDEFIDFREGELVEGWKERERRVAAEAGRRARDYVTDNGKDGKVYSRMLINSIVAQGQKKGDLSSRGDVNKHFG